jgi:hypothetical protein
MSLRYEQYRSLLLTKRLLAAILVNPHSHWTATDLKERASQALKHFPPLTENGEPQWSKDRLTQDEIAKWDQMVWQLREDMIDNRDDWDHNMVTTTEDWLYRLNELLTEANLEVGER